VPSEDRSDFARATVAFDDKATFLTGAASDF
jgi:hypothetical protein